MKLFLAQIEKEWAELDPYEYGEVSDEVMGKILVMDLKWKKPGKVYTMQSLLDSIGPHDVAGYAQMKEYWTNDLRKPKDVQFCGVFHSVQYGAVVLKWRYTEQFNDRMKKKTERRDQKLKAELEAIRQKKQKGGKK